MLYHTSLLQEVSGPKECVTTHSWDSIASISALPCQKKRVKNLLQQCKVCGIYTQYYWYYRLESLSRQWRRILEFFPLLWLARLAVLEFSFTHFCAKQQHKVSENNWNPLVVERSIVHVLGKLRSLFQQCWSTFSKLHYYLCSVQKWVWI